VSAAVLSLFLVAAAGQAGSAAPLTRIKWEKNFEEALKRASKSGKPVIVDFWADWCTWCERLDQNTYTDPAVVQKAQEFVAVRVNTEGSHKELEVAVRYHVTSLPTIVFVSPEGRQLGRVNGYQGAGQFPRTLETVQVIARRVMSWEEALRGNPDDPGALAALGIHSFEQECFDEARDLLSRSAVLDADLSVEERRRTRMYLAVLENMDRHYAQAEKLVKEALAFGPRDADNPRLLFLLGRTYVQWGRHAEGVATMEIIVRDYPQSPIAQKARETLTTLGPR
jgi:thioredoxin-related protein